MNDFVKNTAWSFADEDTDEDAGWGAEEDAGWGAVEDAGWGAVEDAGWGAEEEDNDDADEDKMGRGLDAKTADEEHIRGVGDNGTYGGGWVDVG